MKIPLVGESYTLRSPAAGCQQTLNLIPQFIDDPNGQAKNKGILVGLPGYHPMGNLDTLSSSPTGDEFCGLFSGGGNCYAVTFNSSTGLKTLWQIGLGSYVGGNPSSGSATVVSKHTINYPTGYTPTGAPAQMFGNGNQLLIVTDGLCWIDNGSGPLTVRFLISGTVNTAPSGGGSTVSWVSGDEFSQVMDGGFAGTNYITIDGTNYTIDAWISPTSLTLVENAGTQTGALFQSPAGDFVTAVTGAYLDGYFVVQRPIGLYQIAGLATSTGTTLTWASGDFFEDLQVGQTITFNSTNYIVDTIVSSTVITLTTSAGSANAGFSAFVGVDLGRQFNLSYPDDGTSWDPLDFATKEGYPDHLVSILADHEQLYLLGEESLEIWQDTGNALFPFQRISGAMAKEGSVATYGAVAMNEKVFYIGDSERGTPVAYALNGFTPVRISTHAVEAAWASGIDTPSLAIAYAEAYDGHQNWVINFQGALGTWVYDDTATQLSGSPVWHQRAAWTGTAFANYVPRFHTFLPEWGPAGMHVVGDFASANFFEQSLNYYDDDGGTQQWNRIVPALYAGGKRQFFGRMTLEMDTGSTTSATVQPAVLRSYSDDRGNTFGNSLPPIQGGSGVMGAFSQRVVWPANGSSYDRVFEFTGNNNGDSRTCLIDLELEVEIGDY